MQRQTQNEIRLMGWKDSRKIAPLDFAPQRFMADAATGGIFIAPPERTPALAGLWVRDFSSELDKAQPAPENQTIENVFPREAHDLMVKNRNEKSFVVLDVTRPKEFDKLHLENAVNLDFFSKDFKTRLRALDKDKTYLIYCKIGGRSKMAQNQMKRLGFKKVYNLKGGTILWQEEGLPFASDFDHRTRFTFCPFSMYLMLSTRLRKFFKKGYGFVWPRPRQSVN